MKAFTLIELMVVLAITGVMLALGTWGLVSLQRSILVKGAGDSIINSAKETQNKAKNGVFDVGQSSSLYLNDIFAFKITFTSTGVTRSTCYRLPTALNWTCLANPENIIDAQYAEVDFYNGGTTCMAVLFVGLTGDIRVNTGDPASLIDSSYGNGNCVVVIRHKTDFNATKTVTFNGGNNGFSVTP